MVAGTTPESAEAFAHTNEVSEEDFFEQVDSLIINEEALDALEAQGQSAAEYREKLKADFAGATKLQRGMISFPFVCHSSEAKPYLTKDLSISCR